MKNKVIALLIGSSLMSMAASSQTIKENIDKAHRDKDAKDRSAKADVIILKRTIADSTQKTTAIVKQQPAVNAVTTVKHKYKYKKKKKSK